MEQEYIIIPNLTYLGNRVYYKPSNEKEDAIATPVATLVSNPENTYVAQAYIPTGLNNNNNSSVLSATNVAQAYIPTSLNNNNSSSVLSDTMLPPDTQLSKITMYTTDSLGRETIQKNYTFYKAKYEDRFTEQNIIGYIELGKYMSKNHTNKSIKFTKGTFFISYPTNNKFPALYYDPTSGGGNKRRKSYRRRRVSGKRKSRKSMK